MKSNDVNPYQPPTPTATPKVESDGHAVSFYTTDANLRFAESRFVIRLHPLRLIVVSLVLIAASTVVMISSLFFGNVIFGISSVVTMVISALVYLASVYRSKLRLRLHWARLGMQDGTISSVAIDQNALVLNSPAGLFRWPIDTVKLYRTRKGMMLSPEPMLCLFVPKINQSSPDVYDDLQMAMDK